MNKIITSLVVALAMTSCDKKSVLDDYYAEITDKDLKEAIIEYDSLQKIKEKEPYVIEVSSYSVGDTLVEYYISKGLSGSIGWDHNPILYVSNVNGKDVVFTSDVITKNNSFVRINKKIEDELVRRNFPDIYPKYISGQPYRCVLRTGGDFVQLFYHRGKLIYKNKTWPAVSFCDVAELIAEGHDNIEKALDRDNIFGHDNMEVLRAGGHHCAACEHLGKQAEKKNGGKNRGKDFVFDVVEQMPSFPGGMKAMMEYLKENTEYPAKAVKNKIQGRVIVQFTVDEKGRLSDIKVVKSVEPYLDAEAVRVVKSMPRWNPGMQNGKAVKVRYTLPVTFRLQ
ncbi:MAG: energy transducer TonB [Prevotella sp.]|nr:energy transducer TonB [Prevotella sp.]